MKKLVILAALLMLLPVSAMAGMSAVSDTDLEEVTGQVGLTITMTVTVTASTIAWGDSDGFGPTYTSQGWVILSNVTTPNFQLTGVTIDAGSDNSSAYVCINTGATNIISGNMTIGALIIGTTGTATGASTGEIRMTGLGVQVGALIISGH